MLEQKSYNWGILGPGNIANKFADALNGINRAKIHAVGSRDLSRAKIFADKFNIKKAYGSYEELVQDPDVQIIYISTPHHLHYEMTKLCLENGKAVLCEKPVCINARQFEELSALAKTQNLFYMDAFWTRFLPSIKHCLKLLPQIGDIKYFHANFGFLEAFDPKSRAFDPIQGGGALLDIGIYPVFLSKLFLGDPHEILAKAVFGSTGTDDSISMIFSYKSGAIANLYSTFLADTSTMGEISGTKGRIILKNKVHHPSVVELITINEEKKIFQFEFDVNGFEYEAIECMDCMDKGFIESQLLPHSFTYALMKILDRVRKIIDLRYLYD